MHSSTLTKKLILNLLFVGIGAIVIVGSLSFYTAKNALMNRTYEQLTSLRVLKKNHVETFINDRQRDIRLVANSQDIQDVLLLLNRHFSTPDKTNKPLQISFSRNRYLSRYLNACGYYKKLFICNEKGNGLSTTTSLNADSTIFYSPNIATPPLILLWKKVRKSLHTEIEDFNFSQSVNPAIYVCSPIFDKNNHLSGMVTLEIALQAINNIMIEKNLPNGLGQTGETYLVGSDSLIRNDSRFRTHSAYKTKVKTQAVLNALAGKSGTERIRDYRNIKVLSSYDKLNIPGLNWVIIAEMDYREAIIPIYKIRNQTIGISLAVALVLCVFIFFFSRRITQPIIKLKEAATRVGQGKYDSLLEVRENDEIGALTESFNQMTGQLRAKDLELRQERLKRMRSVFDGQEQERQRISRELHDGLGQLLIAIKLKLETLIHTDRSKFIYLTNQIKDMFDHTIDEIRSMSNDLMPAVLNEFGLVTALRNLCDEISERHKIIVTFESDKIPDTFGKKTKTYLYRIAQEALINVAKHAEARKASVKLIKDEDFIQLMIEDNGKGFTFGDGTTEMGNGIHNMRERVTLLNGTFTVASDLGKGTSITIKIPLKKSEQGKV